MPLKVIKDEDLKIYYAIGEVARHLGVNPSLIRFWEKEFPQLKPKKNRRGDRLYTKKDIQLLEKIYQLVKVEGYTLEGARKHLSARRPTYAEEVSPAQSGAMLPSAEDTSQAPSQAVRNHSVVLTSEERNVIKEKLLAAYAGILNIELKLKDFLQRSGAGAKHPTLFEWDGRK